jgi:pimeloyl-ACP methyl ester carboxylesterase
MADQEETDPVRADGPRVVWEGPAGAPALLVFDPAGAGKHDELPATWREFGETRQVLWCRLPAEGALAEAEDALGDPSALGRQVDVVASGPVAEIALEAVHRHPDGVRSLLLVDPAAGRRVAGDPEEADADWIDLHERERAGLERAGISMQVIAHSHGGDEDRVPPPLPLGHPQVVAAVRAAVS